MGGQLGVRRGQRAVAQRGGQLRDHGRAAARDRLVEHARCALGRDEHEPPGLRVGADDLEVAAEAGQQPLGGVADLDRRRQQRGELAQRAGALAPHERVEQPGQVVEVAVDDRAADAGLARDALDRDGVEAVLGPRSPW